MIQPSVHIVDDDPAVRDALGWLLRSVEVRAFAWPDAASFIEGAPEGLRGCILLDVRMPGISGIEAFDILSARNCQVPVIFLTGHGDVPMAVSAMKAGAFDFVEKPYDEAVLLETIRRAMAWDAVQKEREERAAQLHASLQQLTEREREVMECILAGKLNKVIADELGIAMRTVEVHRSRIFEKMKVRSAVELSRLLSSTIPQPSK